MKTKTSYIAAGIFAALVAMTDLAAAQTAVVERTTETTSAGSVTEFGADDIVIHSDTAPDPLRYTFRKTTTYVDEAGNPVAREVIKSGVPVTIQYVREGDRLIASKVIVRRTVERAPAVIEQHAPAVIEQRTTTTTTTTK